MHDVSEAEGVYRADDWRGARGKRVSDIHEFWEASIRSVVIRYGLHNSTDERPEGAPRKHPYRCPAT